MKIFFIALLICSSAVSFAQLPSSLLGIDPSTISKDDLDKYGLTEGDIQNLMQQYGQKKSSNDKTPTNNSAVEESKEVVIKDNEVKPTEVKLESQKVDNHPEEDNYVYGRNLLNNKNLKIYENATHIKASPNYILGSGDEISISIWGYSEHSGNYTVGQDGSIKAKLVGNVYLKGQTFEKAQQIIKSKFGKVYDLKNSQISIELNYSKVIRVNIVGEVKNPGTYSVPSINSVFNILAISGGINSNGTVRNIEIKRDGKTISTLDVYEFLRDPSYKNDFYLMENDFIVVGNIGNVVHLSGEVKREESYEMKPNEGIRELIEYSGGILASAYTKYINLSRYLDNRDVLIEIPFDSLAKKNKNFLLEDGDRIVVKPIPVEVRNRVTVSGSVNINGFFLYEEGLTVKKLISKGEGLKNDAFLERAYIKRLNPDYSYTTIHVNLLDELEGHSITNLQEFDEFTVFSKKDFLEDFFVEIRGEVKKPVKINYTNGITLGDLLFMAGGLKKEASVSRIEISRIFPKDDEADDARVIIKALDIERDLLSEQNKQTILQPGDIVIVRMMPQFEAQEIIQVRGEVKFPGSYAIASKDEKISDIIERAGGLTEWSFLEGAYIERSNSVGGSGLTVLDLKKLFNGNDKFDYVIRKGDVLVIPRVEDFIKLRGDVRFPKVQEFGEINIPVHKSKRAGFYIRNYGGGFDKTAKKSRTYVETPGGYVKRTVNFGLFKVYPEVRVGDKITVIQKEAKVKKEKRENPLDWNRVIENTTVKLTGVATLWVLLQRINL